MGTASSSGTEITVEDKKLILEVWQVVMQNPEENGIVVLKRFFGEHSSYLEKFKKFQGIPIDEIPNTPIFRKHARLIIETLDGVITKLDEPETLETPLIDLGKLHRRKTITEENFNELKNVILSIFKDEFKISQEAHRSWNKVFDIAYFYIFKGLNEGNA